MSATDETQSNIPSDVFEGFDSEPEPPQEPREDPVPVSSTEEMDDVEKQVIERAWHFEGTIKGMVRGQIREEKFERDYVQKPLSYLAMMQFTGLLGRSIDSAMSGPEGLSMQGLGDVMSIAGASNIFSGGLGASDFEGIDAFVRGFAKLAAYVPDLVAEAQCIWLRVPLRDRMALVELWSKPVDEGGLSSDEGEEMLTLFIDQNYEELERFSRAVPQSRADMAEGEEEASSGSASGRSPARRMTAIEALESYSGSHPETVEVLLEWPARRFRVAFEAWQRREIVKEWQERKRAHLNALFANGNLKEPGEAIRETTDYYDSVIDELTMTDAERAEIDAEMDTEFMRAGRRSAARVLEQHPVDVQLPGQKAFEKLPRESGRG